MEFYDYGINTVSPDLPEFETYGTYKLQIIGGPSNLGSYPLLLEYDIYSTKTASNPLAFPASYGIFSQSDMQTIKPFYNPLTGGDAVYFKIRTATFDT